MPMKRLIIVITLSALVFAPPSKGSAQVRGTAMGNLVSVISDGPFDAARNPALLALQPADTALAAYVRYRAFDDTDIENKSSLHMDTDEPKTFNAGAVAAYSMKFSGPVLGLAVGEMGRDLLSKRKSGVTYHSGIMEKEEEDTFETNPSLAVALGLPLAGGSSFGVQLITTYGYKRTEKTSDYCDPGYIPPAPYCIARLGKNTGIEKSISARAGFGYSLQTPATQIGLLLTSGTVTLAKNELEYNHVEFDIAAPALHGRDSTPYKAYYTESPRLVFGGYHRLSPRLGFAFEAAYTILNITSRKERDIAVNVLPASNDSVTPLERNYTVTTDDSLQFKGGLEFTARDGLSFTFGAGYDFQKSTRESKIENQMKIRLDMEVIYAMLGAHLALGQGTGISILLSGGRAAIDMSMDLNKSFSIVLDDTVYMLDAAIAVTTRY